MGDDVGLGEAHSPPVGIAGVPILLINTVDLNLAIPSIPPLPSSPFILDLDQADQTPFFLVLVAIHILSGVASVLH